MPGRYRELRFASSLSWASSARRAHIVTWAPPSARILPKVVPQLPAPITAARVPVGIGIRLGVKAACLLLSVLTGVPPLLRRRLVAQLLQQRRDRRHQPVGRLVERRGLTRTAGEVGEIHRIAVDDQNPLAQRPQ